MDLARARENMVWGQLRPNRITDPRLLAAMAEVPRERFLPAALRAVAYADEDLELGDGRRLIEPLALAKMLQAASVRPEDTALVIGRDVGYAAAVLARLATTVFLLVEREEEAEHTDRLLNDIGAENVVVRRGDPRRGLPELAPFDVILLTGAVPAAPRTLLDQLQDGGRLVAVVTENGAGRVEVWQRVGDSFGHQAPFDAWIPPCPAFQPEPGFRF